MTLVSPVRRADPPNLAGPMQFWPVIFDCDGVLIDTEHLQAQTTWEAMQAVGHSMTLEAVLGV